MIHNDYYWLIMDYEHDSGLWLFATEISQLRNFLTLNFLNLKYFWGGPTFINDYWSSMSNDQWSLRALLSFANLFEFFLLLLVNFCLTKPYLALRTSYTNISDHLKFYIFLAKSIISSDFIYFRLSKEQQLQEQQQQCRNQLNNIRVSPKELSKGVI